MKLKTSVCFMMATFMALTACSTGAPFASPALKHAAKPAQTAPGDTSFFMTAPFSPDGNQVLEIRRVETAFMSIATMETDLPLDSWTKLGWAIGNTLSESDQVPQDCVLHFRTGVDHQAYAACAGPAKVAIPNEGGDFVYIVVTDADNRIARVMETGARYNPDTTGLIP